MNGRTLYRHVRTICADSVPGLDASFAADVIERLEETATERLWVGCEVRLRWNVSTPVEWVELEPFPPGYNRGKSAHRGRDAEGVVVSALQALDHSLDVARCGEGEVFEFIAPSVPYRISRSQTFTLLIWQTAHSPVAKLTVHVPFSAADFNAIEKQRYHATFDRSLVKSFDYGSVRHAASDQVSHFYSTHRFDLHAAAHHEPTGVFAEEALLSERRPTGRWKEFWHRGRHVVTRAQDSARNLMRKVQSK